MSSSAAKAREAVRPIMSLYREILRAHLKLLPPPMRSLGDAYARDEFRRHLEGNTTQTQWVEFGAEWSKYLNSITGGSVDGRSAAGGISGELDAETIAKLSPEQLMMLERLKEEATSFSLDDDGDGASRGDNKK